MALPMNAEGQVALAFWAGICVTAMSVLLLAVVLVLRQLAQRRERNHLRAAALWKQNSPRSNSAPAIRAPSTCTCFSSRCQPRGRTISTVRRSASRCGRCPPVRPRCLGAT